MFKKISLEYKGARERVPQITAAAMEAVDEYLAEESDDSPEYPPEEPPREGSRFGKNTRVVAMKAGINARSVKVNKGDTGIIVRDDNDHRPPVCWDRSECNQQRTEKAENTDGRCFSYADATWLEREADYHE